MTATLKTRIGREPVCIAITHVTGLTSTYSAASYFVGDVWAIDRDLKTVEGITVGDVLEQAYRDLAPTEVRA